MLEIKLVMQDAITWCVKSAACARHATGFYVYLYLCAHRPGIFDFEKIISNNEHHEK